MGVLAVRAASVHDAVAARGWAVAVAAALPVALCLTLALAAAIHLTERHPVRPGGLRAAAVAHGRAAALYAIGSTAAGALVDAWLGTPNHLGPAVTAVLRLLDYAALLAVTHAVWGMRRFRRAHDAWLRATAEWHDAERRRAESELRALKSQLDPHFLGNALQAVASLLREAPDAAATLLYELRRLTQSAAARRATLQVRLSEELGRLEPFLAVERIRLRGRLDVALDVAPDVADAWVPDLLLQPLVENAVRHGLAPRGGGRLRIVARRASGDRLHLRVEDDGVGPGDARPGSRSGAGAALDGMGVGIGSANVRERLRTLYGPSAAATMTAGEGGGTVVALDLPLYLDAPSPAPASPPSGPHDAATRVAPHTDGAPAPAARPSPPWWRTRLADRAGVARVVWVGAGFAALSALLASVAGRVPLPDGALPSPARALGVGVLTALVWSVAIGLAARLTRHGVTRDGDPGPSVSARARRHILAAAVVAGLAATLKLGMLAATLPLPADLARQLLLAALTHALVYVAAALAFAGLAYPRRARRAEREALALQRSIAATRAARVDAELRALKSAINPQIIDRALATAAVHVHTDPVEAERVLGLVAQVLRDFLTRAATHEVSLAEEIAGLESVLALGRSRHGMRHVVEWDLAPDTLEARIPHLLLAPFVDGARSEACLRVTARRTDGRLTLTVARGRDAAGPGEPAEADGGSGADEAVRLTLARLTEMYGAAARLELLPAADAVVPDELSDAALAYVHGGTATLRFTMPYLEDDAELPTLAAIWRR